jgi:hypothetical protein
VEAIKEEEEEEESNHGVDISPTFLRFRVSNSSRSSRSRSSTNRSLTTSQNGSREEEEASSGHGNGHVVGVHREKVTLMNHSKEIKRFQIKSGHEHVLISPKEGTIEPFNTQLIRIRILSQPFQPKKKAKQNKTKPNLNLNQTQNQMKQQEETWCGSFTICITSNSSNETEMQQQIVREISIVLDPEILNVLPTFEEMVRLQHHLSLQTDSFYYSSSQKDNNTTTRHPNRGLYFHAEAVECGQCPLGEAHQVCVYLCNGSENPMTVFLQNLQEPFRCEYKTTTIKSKSYIPMTIIFRPKAKGKVSTSLTAYSLTTRASMTLIATGISK